MNTIAIEKMTLKQKWTDIVWDISGGGAADYEVLKGKDVFEFFSLLRSYTKRIKRLNANNKP